MLRRLLLWNLPWILAAATAVAQTSKEPKDVRDLQMQATQMDNEATQAQAQGHQAIFESLSKQLNVPVETLQAEQKSTNFGFGQLFIANALASSTGKTFDQIAQEFKSGKGWGEIAKENNVKLGKVVSSLKRANQQIEKNRMEQGQQNAGSGASQGQGRGNSGASSNSGQGAGQGAGMGQGHGGGPSAPPRGRR